MLNLPAHGTNLKSLYYFTVAFHLDDFGSNLYSSFENLEEYKLRPKNKIN